MKKYKRITEDERNEIVVMLSKNKSVREIAKKLLWSAAQIAIFRILAQQHQKMSKIFYTFLFVWYLFCVDMKLAAQS
jgi:IS30 family transposase